MARQPIVTFEQVAAIANQLYAEGTRDPGTKAIRAELAKRAGPGEKIGSPNTIQKHLDAWRQKARPADPQEVPQLPPQLAADISRALMAASSMAREIGEERLAQMQSEINELVTVGEGLEARLDELQDEVAAKTSERDSMAGQLAQRVDEVTELKAALALANERGAAAERELHAAQALAQAAEGRVDEIRQSTDRQLAKLQGELDQARQNQAKAERAAVEADKRAVAAEAHLESERVAKAAVDAQVVDLQASVKRLESDAAKASAAQASADGLRDQVALLTGTVTMLRSMLEASGKALPADGAVSGDLQGDASGRSKPKGK